MVRTGGGATILGGTTNKVMLWFGTVALSVFTARLTSLNRVMALAEVSCHTWAESPAEKFVRFIVSAALNVNCLLMTITVKAPSDERTAANSDTSSGFGPPAKTLMSPKVDLLAS